MKHLSIVYTQLIDQTILFLAIQFSLSHLFAHSLNVKQFYLIKSRTLSGATTPVPREPVSEGIEGVLRIPQSSSPNGALPSAGLVSLLEHSLRVDTPLQRCY